jgi:hypothetical protein
MTIPHWYEDPQAWDRLVLGRDEMPGVWDVQFKCKRGLDVKKAKGRDGARFKDEGYDPSMIQLVGKLTTADEWRRLQRVIPKIRPRVMGRSRTPIEIDHPKTKLLSIRIIYIVEVSAVKIQKGILTQEINVLEWVDKPKPVKSSNKPPEKKRDLQQEDRELLDPDSVANGP